MCKICGYDCEYNKSGVCQITGCIKMSEICEYSCEHNKSRLVSTMNSVNVDDLMSAIHRLKKVPTNQDLLRENKRQKEVIDKAIEYINKYESIKAYYEYIDEDGYEEYNYDENFKKDILDILKEVPE